MVGMKVQSKKKRKITIEPNNTHNSRATTDNAIIRPLKGSSLDP
jgi:hypothetical protein